MPPRLAAPVLTVDAGKMHKVDPRNVESLFGMWTVFSKCAESIEGGKRLENMSWRLWNRETFCCEAQPQYSITPAMEISQTRSDKKDVPSLSSSVESASSDEDDSPSSDDSALSRSRGKEKHITSLGLEKMVYSIKEQTDLEPLLPSITSSFPALISLTLPSPPSPPSPQIEPLHPEPAVPIENLADSCTSAVTFDSARTSEHRDSDTSVSSGGLIRSGSVVHGFAPSPISSSLRAQISPEIGIPVAINSTNGGPSKKALAGVFTLGGSSGDDESSFEEGMAQRATRTSLADRLHQSDGVSRPSPFQAAISRKQVLPIKEGHDEDEGAIESDDDEIDESAIEEEDESDWEDSLESNRSSLVEDKTIFKRVDSRANLVSRKSLLTTGLHEPQRAAAMAEAAMKSASGLRRSPKSSPIGPSGPASPTADEPALLMQAANGTKAKPIIYTTTNTHNPAHSPRTTRRNMLATELTESLRRHLLWERQQKSTTANAVFKRRHTAHNDLTNLQEYPGPKPRQPLIDASKNNSWNHWNDTGPWDFHARGW